MYSMVAHQTSRKQLLGDLPQLPGMKKNTMNAKKTRKSQIDDSIVVGQGTYGCVHKPQLKCRNRTQRKKDVVSKLMTMKNANQELKEYKGISNADPELDIYLGNPKSCLVEHSIENIKAINQCRDFTAQDMDKYKLLLMKDGGRNLEQFGNYIHAKWKPTPENKRKIEMFWLEATRLFYGLQVFAENGIVHHDLKHQNIVYNEEKNRLNYIDFGMMSKKETIVNNAKRSNYWLSNDYHWSFPFEIVFWKKNTYANHVGEYTHRKQNLYDTYFDDIHSKCGYFFKSIAPVNATNDQKNKLFTKALKRFYKLTIEMEDNEYNTFLNKSIDTIDSYGVGMGLMYVLNRCVPFLDKELHKNIEVLLMNMVDPNLNTRLLPKESMAYYNRIIYESGLLEKHNMRFKDNLIVPGQSIPVKIEEKIKEVSKEPIPNAKMEKISIDVVRECPEGKEYKSITKRCVNVCKPGYKRNADFKCVKETRKSIQYKACVPGKDFNPITGRCVKKCKSGFGRNKTFKCRKMKIPFA